MNDAINNWIKSSDYDIKTALVMFNGKRYIYVIFMCHLSTEKLLKAIVAKVIKKVPPKTHDLLYLIKLANIEIPMGHQKIIAHLNQTSIPTRYPEDISKIAKQYTKETAQRYLNDTQNLLKWLKSQIK
ncbi:MAG: HEPN domain-containing protein [Candidatus Omnitrophota bacterium]